MNKQDISNQNYVRVARCIKFPSTRGVPERRGVFSGRGEEHPVIASQCHPSTRGESTVRGVLNNF
ncbi:MAG: hypothetical protein UT91_C0012G0032 [Parcubacteria group bacterium GW2011_GWA2_40_23]|nr:MAG: hypothetical protein UT91_C0012G0032 [Parcubacteria group bacterium GW2011_GWA2_40_23]